MDNKNTSIIIAIIITALVVGSGIYFWQYSNIAKSENKNLQQKNQLQQQIDTLNSQVNQLSQQKEEMQQQIDSLNAQLNPPMPERYIKVISPNGKEILCRDNNFVISWESKGVSAVTLSVAVSEAGSSGNYIIGTVSASSSETGKPGEGMYVWNVGHTRGVILSEGVNYKISIGSAEGTPVSDTSDNAFEILICKG